MNNKLRSLILCSAILGFGSAHAAYVNVNDATLNKNKATALNLDANFDKQFDANIGKPIKNISTTFFHASVNTVTGKAGGNRDWYSFTTYQKDVQAYFDIDNSKTLDSFVSLYNAKGKFLGSNDNGNVNDPGSVVGNGDSFLAALLAKPGMYFVSVGKGSGNAGIAKGQNYTLHISLQRHTNPALATPIPAAVWLFGSALAGLVGIGRRKNSMPVSAAV